MEQFVHILFTHAFVVELSLGSLGYQTIYLNIYGAKGAVQRYVIVQQHQVFFSDFYMCVNNSFLIDA